MKKRIQTILFLNIIVFLSCNSDEQEVNLDDPSSISESDSNQDSDFVEDPIIFCEIPNGNFAL